MKLAIFFIILNFAAYSQRLYKSPYEKKTDSLSIANFKIDNIVAPNNHVYTFMPYDWVKFTIKARVNNNVTSKINLTNGFGGLFRNMEYDDFISLGSYDVRMRVYLSKNVRFLQTMIINGIQNHTYTYTSGFIIKF